MNATLTATGVIATILSVIFAFAAYFVQHKKNNSSKAVNQVPDSEGIDGTAHVVTTRHGFTKEKKRRVETATGKGEPAMVNSDHPTSDAGAKPLFRKYSAKGGYEEDAGLDTEDEALWE